MNGQQSSIPPYILEKTSIKIAAVCSFIFFIIQLIGIFHHEPWMDEFQAFQIAMNSHSLGNLFFNMRQEGHGAEWFLVLYAVTRFTHDIFAMQVTHIIIATGGIYIFFRYAPFSLIEKIIISLGCFFFYEYAQISREYVLGVFFVICFCAVVGEKYYRRKLSGLPFPQTSFFYTVACLLILLGDSGPYGLIISFALASYFLWIILSEYKNIISNRKLITGLSFALLIILLGWIIAVIQIKPPADNGFGYRFSAGINLAHPGKTITQLMVAYFPFPLLKIKCWNSYYIWPDVNKSLTIVYLLVIAIIALIFIKKPPVLFLYLMSMVLIGGFILYANLYIVTRSLGHSFITLFVCFWFDRYITPNQKILPFIPASILIILKKFVFYTIMIIQAVAGIFFYYMDFRYPFSNCIYAGRYVIENHLDRFPLVGGEGWAITPISYFTNKPAFVFERNDTSRFAIYDGKSKNLNRQEFFNEMIDQVNKSKNDTVLVGLTVELLINKNGENVPLEEESLGKRYRIKSIDKITTVTLQGTYYYFYLAWKNK